MPYIKAGTGIDIGHDFTRLMTDTPIIKIEKTHRPLEVRCTIAGDMESRLGFMRRPTVDAIVQTRFIVNE